MAKKISAALGRIPYDLVIASQRDMACYLDGIKHPVALLEELELSALHEAAFSEKRVIQRMRARLTWWKTARYYRKLLVDFVAVTAVSREEMNVIQHVAQKVRRLEVIPNGIDLDYYRAGETTYQPYSLLYCGSLTYDANFDAVCFFLEKIFPTVRCRYPAARLRVTGGLQGVNLERLPNQDGVEFTGYLADVRPVVARSCVSVVPLQYGGGTRLKILESLAMGTPVVATRKGAEGLEIQSGEGILIAQNPKQFGQYVIDIFEQPDLRRALSLAGKNSVRTYDWEKIGPQFNRLVIDLVQETSKRLDPIQLRKLRPIEILSPNHE